MYYVYILKSVRQENRIYIGCTKDLSKRLKYHNAKLVPSTKAYTPFEIETYFAFKNKILAFNFEAYLKTSSGRAFLNKRLIKRDEN